MPELSDDAAANRAAWDQYADTYQQNHHAQLDREPMSWGLWSLPESELDILGPVKGQDVLELGCGAAQWSVALAQEGARVVGLDNSAAQLRHARARMKAAGLDFPLLHASTEAVPLPDQRFDIIFCDHGAMSFLDPALTLPEVARLLRPGGRFAFNASSTLLTLCFDEENDVLTERLCKSTFELGRNEYEGFVEHVRSHGEWIRLFGENGLVVERLVELRPPAGATSSYRYTPLAWARRWPAEELWVLRRS
ncbi:MAG: ubiquinone/menaquinone biosynthesis C-methylase UbiE [Myxococcota bacterium]|jgi:ubiquinone/menaquinone biosynthesis C-methylase UbiE